MFPDPSSASAALFRRAQSVMPGGNSRHTVSFEPYPVYASDGQGCHVTDADGVRRLDFVNNYSSLIHGHSHREVLAAVTRQASRLMAIGAPTECEIELAELLVERLPAVERVRFTNSGTEAVMLALRAARAYTGKSKIAKIEGAYHGSYDYAQVSQAPSPDTWGNADAPASVVLGAGTPGAVANDVVVVPFNNPEAAARILREHADDLAAILIDVMPAHLAYVQASPEFLRIIQGFVEASETLLVLDEVYSLRLDFRGAQTLYNLRPDLVAMGKIIGGGLPIGAVGGSSEVMAVFEPRAGLRMVPHGGTFNANPMSMSAGLAAMRSYTPAAVAELNALGQRARTAIRESIDVSGIEAQVTGHGSLLAIRFNDRTLRNYRDLGVSKIERAQIDYLYKFLLNSGILAAPQLFFILSTPMRAAEIDRLAEACLSGFRLIAAGLEEAQYSSLDSLA